VIDSNILLALWHGRFPSPTKVKVRTKRTAKLVVLAWLKINPGDGVLTPIRLELVGGGLDRDAVRLTDYFLDLFPLLDGGDVRREDWDAASRLARRVPFAPRPRGAVDCLIRAICQRLGLQLETLDTGLPPG
jgi:predicted nucleic acid-binding protein